jgi:hypothetical protein
LWRVEKKRFSRSGCAFTPAFGRAEGVFDAIIVGIRSTTLRTGSEAVPLSKAHGLV